jgi:hypothetical protein
MPRGFSRSGLLLHDSCEVCGKEVDGRITGKLTATLGVNKMKKVDRLFGTMGWYGIINGMPAIIGSYYKGCALYVFDGEYWYEYATSFGPEYTLIPKENA